MSCSKLTKILGVAALLITLGCSDSAPKNAPGKNASPQLERTVREVIAEHMKIKPSDIDMSKPLTSLKADDLDIVEMVMTLEERLNITIPDSVLDKRGGGLVPNNGPSRLTPADLVAAAEESMSNPTPRRKK